MTAGPTPTGLGWPEVAKDDVSRETSKGLPTGLGWPATAEATGQNVSRETLPGDSA